MRMLIFSAALVLGGCAAMTESPQPQVIQGVWVRTDGQSGRDNPALAQQFEVDRAACRTSVDVDRACMAGKGYILVPASEAAAKAAELRSRAGTPTAPPAPPPSGQSGT